MIFFFPNCLIQLHRFMSQRDLFHHPQINSDMQNTKYTTPRNKMNNTC